MSDELIRKLDVIEIMENLIYDMSEVSTIPQLAKSAIEKLEPVNAVELPCKIGDKVFEPITKGGTIYSRTVKGFTVSERIELINCETKNFYWFEIGKKVFLTREEAEKALEDLKNG